MASMIESHSLAIRPNGSSTLDFVRDNHHSKLVADEPHFLPPMMICTWLVSRCSVR
jgi:hypothetical protein